MCGMPVDLSHVLVRSSSGLLTRLETESQCGRVLDCPPHYRHQSSRNTSWSPRLRCCLFGSSSLLERIPVVQYVQCAWALLLHSAADLVNYQVTVVRPALTEAFARARRWVVARFSVCPWTQESSPETLLPCPGAGWVGTLERSPIQAVRLLASWADTLSMVRMRQRAIAESFVEALVCSGLPSEFDGCDGV